MEEWIETHYYTLLLWMEAVRYVFYGWFALAFWLLWRAQRGR